MLPQINRYHSGSTDLKEGQIIEQWAEADPEYQIFKGKYSLAAKISMDEAALKFGEDHPDIRIVIFNPSMIVGPMFHPDMHGSLAFFKDILSQGDQLKEVPDDSMSFIDVRDLAQLELAALENKNAKGTYVHVLKDKLIIKCFVFVTEVFLKVNIGHPQPQ